MSKTAKQNPTKVPAQTAAKKASEKRAAATQGEVKPEAAAEPEQSAGASGADSATSDLDETKRKFREALEHKHQAHSDSQGNGGRDGGKINGAHGPAASRRSFRRKSG